MHHYRIYCKSDWCFSYRWVENVASRLTSRASLVLTYKISNTAYFPAASCFMRFRALPARNHSICCSFIVWFNEILSTLPSECLISAFNGCNIKLKNILIIHSLNLCPSTFICLVPRESELQKYHFSNFTSPNIKSDFIKIYLQEAWLTCRKWVKLEHFVLPY